MDAFNEMVEEAVAVASLTNKHCLEVQAECQERPDKLEEALKAAHVVGDGMPNRFFLALHATALVSMFQEAPRKQRGVILRALGMAMAKMGDAIQECEENHDHGQTEG